MKLTHTFEAMTAEWRPQDPGLDIWRHDKSATNRGGLARSNNVFGLDREAEGYLG
jgi:hypothetical protein